LPARAGEFGRQPLARGFLQLFKGFETSVLANSSSILVSCGASIKYGGFELGRLAGELLAGVVLRKRTSGCGFRPMRRDQLLFKARNELPGANRHLDVSPMPPSNGVPSMVP